MTDLKNIKEMYFIGVGGIGMSALARYFNERGVAVSGYDRTRTFLTDQLSKEGIDIHYKEDLNAIPEKPDVVVYTPAIPKEHKELQHYKASEVEVLKRSAMLGRVTETGKAICVAGTHGKTTVSTLIAHILKHSGYDCTAFLGGLALNYESNYIAGKNDVTVVEADEYDRSFLQLNPYISVVTAMDADHLDIYGTKENLEAAFTEFASSTNNNGLVVCHERIAGNLAPNCSKQTYSFNSTSADAYVQNLAVKDGAYQFDMVIKNEDISKIEFPIGGIHNIENAVAASSVASHLGVSGEKIKAALGAFKGIYRRFEYKIKTDKQVFIDDYAHHPEELKTLIKSVKQLYPQKKITLVFQPHLYSRTQDFADGFAEELDKVDEVILLPIYPARELPIEGVSSEMILNKVANENKALIAYDELVEQITKRRPELLVTAGAGDIDKLVPQIELRMK